MRQDRRFGAWGTAVLLTLGACDPAAEPSAPPPIVAPEPTYPDGTVLAVDGEPIRADDVDWIADAIGELYPHYVPSQLRRLALTNVVLPIWAIRARDAEARGAALEACRAARATVGADGATENGAPHAGGVHALGIDLWVSARRLEAGVWSEPIELIGRWALVRVESTEPGESGQGEWLELTVQMFPFLDLSYPGATDANTSIEDAIDAAVLEIVEPAWRELVPEAFLFRMRERAPESTDR